MLPVGVPGWSHRKRESDQTLGRALQAGRNVADRSRVTRLGITAGALPLGAQAGTARLP